MLLLYAIWVPNAISEYECIISTFKDYSSIAIYKMLDFMNNEQVNKKPEAADTQLPPASIRESADWQNLESRHCNLGRHLQIHLQGQLC